MELTSACTCPPGSKARNMTGHGQDCPCYAEWYRRYAPPDAGPYVAGDPAPDQVGPPTGPPHDTPARWTGADWPVSDPANPDAEIRASQHIAAQLAGITPESLQAAIGPTPGFEDEDTGDGDGGDGGEQPTGR